ncbi:hypothetical protein DT075_06805 [Bacillus licheniformis]|nr:hypothetical protein DT075_06805 [Bacillus licheniformis]
MTFYNVHGCGLQKGHTELYRGVKRESNVYERLKVEIVVSKVPVEKVAETAQNVLKTGEPGDGKIFSIFFKLRASEDEESLGLDLTLHGEKAYQD